MNYIFIIIIQCNNLIQKQYFNKETYIIFTNVLMWDINYSIEDSN